MFTQEKVEAIENVLPHGSGINYDYKIRVGGARVYASNSYDVMNESGIYVGTLPFTVCYKKTGKLAYMAYIEFNRLTSRGYRIANKYAIREYLYELYYEVENKITELVNE